MSEKFCQLCSAAQDGDLEKVQRCLKDGADVVEREGNDYTSLHFAVEGNNSEVIKLVLAKIKEKTKYASHYINAQGKDGRTPLMWAAQHHCYTASEILLDNDANTEKTDHNGKTALHYAARENSKVVAEILIEKGANVYAEDEDGKKPIHFARAGKCKEVLKLLEEKDDSFEEIARSVGGFALEVGKITALLAGVAVVSVVGPVLEGVVWGGKTLVGAAADAVQSSGSVSYEERERRARKEARKRGELGDYVDRMKRIQKNRYAF